MTTQLSKDRPTVLSGHFRHLILSSLTSQVVKGHVARLALAQRRPINKAITFTQENVPKGILSEGRPGSGHSRRRRRVEIIKKEDEGASRTKDSTIIIFGTGEIPFLLSPFNDRQAT